MEFLFLLIGIVVGLLSGGLIVFLLNLGKPRSNSDEKLRREFETEQMRLQTELSNAEKSIDEQIRANNQKLINIAEITQQLNQKSTDLSISNERLQTVSRENSKLTEKVELHSSELITLGKQHAQILANFQALESSLAEQRQINNSKELENHESSIQLTKLVSENAKLAANLLATEEKLATQKAEIEDIRQKSHLEFESIANRLLEAKSEKFTASNRENIENILLPLKNDIDSFKAKVEETYDKESKERFSLQNEVKNLIEQTDKVSSEANNLAVALKGQVKTQGIWGEMILERILEINGLVRGREYDVQHSIKNEDGDQQFLDVVVHLPDNRKLIIDSKVTLNAYNRYCASETEEDRARHLKDHIQALTTHIDQLSRKKYDEMDESPDFVMLFVSIEPAYLTAIQNDSQLWARAYAKKILLISPTNLMAAVKLVSDLWKRDNQSKNALEIAQQGEKLYDKFVGFLNSMEDVGSHIVKTQDAYNKALGQLKQGRGNLIRQAEKLKELGVKSQKSLPASMINYEAELDEQTIDLSDLLASDEKEIIEVVQVNSAKS